MNSRVAPVREDFFTPRKMLSEKQVLLFVSLEAAMLSAMLYIAYQIVSMEQILKGVMPWKNPFLEGELIILLSLVGYFIISYVLIARRDELTRLVHANLAQAIAFSLKEKSHDSDRTTFVFVFGELFLAVILAIGIYVYLDPDINIIPYPFNYIGFAIVIVIMVLLFSHTRQFRDLIYGPTPVQKDIHQGNAALRRFTYPRTGSIRIAQKRHYEKLRKLRK